jgi:tetratricopeptide (TPR) repeat protein
VALAMLCPARASAEPAIAAGDVALDAEAVAPPAPVLSPPQRVAPEPGPALHEAVELLERGLVEPGRAALEILAAPGRPGFRAALPWLAHVAGLLPDPADLAEAFALHADAEIERLRDAANPELYATARYLRGRAAYAAGRYAEAVASLSRVGASSRYAVEAAWFTAASHVRLRRSVPAIHALRGVLRAVDGRHRADAADFRDLANLSLARIYHAAAVRLDPATNVPIVDSTRLTLAVRHWDRVDVLGRYGQQALYERATAYYLGGIEAHMLGDLHSVLSPHYAVPHPEAELLKIAVYFGMCDYAGGATLIARLSARLTPLLAELDALLRRHEGESLARLVRERRAGRVQVDPALEPLLDTVLAEPRVRRRIKHVERIEAERRLLSLASPEFRSSRLGTWSERALTAALRTAELRVAGEVRRRLVEERARMGEALREAQHLMLVPLGRGFVGVSTAPGRVVVDEEFVLWPFDGEYWKDELGSYRQLPHSRCVALRF